MKPSITKILALVIATVMLTVASAGCEFSIGNTSTTTQPPTTNKLVELPKAVEVNYALSIEKTNFDPGEKFTTTVSGIGANDNINNIIAVALCRPDDPYHEVMLAYDGADGRVYYWHRGTGTSTRVFTAPSIEGIWELRLFANGEVSPPVYAGKLTITVGSSYAQSGLPTSTKP